VSLIRGFPNVKFLTRKLKGGGKLGEHRELCDEKMHEPRYNVRSDFRMLFVMKEKGRDEQWRGDDAIYRTRYFYRILYRDGRKPLRNLGVSEGAKEGAMKGL